jgi:hypothetical protein
MEQVSEISSDRFVPKAVKMPDIDEDEDSIMASDNSDD